MECTSSLVLNLTDLGHLFSTLEQLGPEAWAAIRKLPPQSPDCNVMNLGGGLSAILMLSNGITQDPDEAIPRRIGKLPLATIICTANGCVRYRHSEQPCLAFPHWMRDELVQCLAEALRPMWVMWRTRELSQFIIIRDVKLQARNWPDNVGWKTSHKPDTGLPEHRFPVARYEHMVFEGISAPILEKIFLVGLGPMPAELFRGLRDHLLEFCLSHLWKLFFDMLSGMLDIIGKLDFSLANNVRFRQ